MRDQDSVESTRATRDPVTRAARRQTLLDRIAEQLTDWGCPHDHAHTRAAGLLHLAESHGWSLPAVPAPPYAGPGSTGEGRARARRILAHVRGGCTCDPGSVARLPHLHPVGCPVRDAHTDGSESAQNGAGQPATTSGVSQ